MRFGPVPVDEAEGAVLAHSAGSGPGRIRKGTVLDAGHLTALRAAGLDAVIVARLGPGDVGEDAAAGRLAEAMRGDGLTARAAFTGRGNLHADGPGVLEVDAARIDAVNAVDAAITVATLPRWQRVAAGTMAATVKIIAFGVDGARSSGPAPPGPARFGCGRRWRAARR